ncbi:hypothetical protein F4677DRAFT_430210 [Hypoxylon crocopeplum]|nr:hypothetical protein F4677DRAFT_430210 [Hypoxylon crocopeplum]
MLVLGYRPDWQQQLRDTCAAEHLRAGRHDQIPLREIQKATDELFSGQRTLFWSRRTLPNTTEGDVLLVSQLQRSKDEFPIHEVGLIACFHVLTYDQARGQLLSIIPNAKVSQEFFDLRTPVYLQCLILANQIRNDDVCSDFEAKAARELLKLVQETTTTCPTIWTAVKVVGKTHREALLPVEFITEVVKRNHYREILQGELKMIRRSRRWSQAYALVHGLRDVVGIPEAAQLLPNVLSNYAMWASWRPNTTRVSLWDNKSLSTYRNQLRALLDLEGPDHTGQQRGTLRHSELATAALLNSHDSSFAEHLLGTFDQAVLAGPEAVRLFVLLCVQGSKPSAQSLEQVNAVLELGHEPSNKSFSNLVESLGAKGTVYDRMEAITSTLPILQSSPRLQKSLGQRMDLGSRGPSAFTDAQKEFVSLLLKRKATERLALKVRGFGYALLQATCFHPQWQPAYIDMLKRIPSDMEIEAVFLAMQSSQGVERQTHVDFLAGRLGSSVRRGQPPPSFPEGVVIQDPIWSAEIDFDRSCFRDAIRRVRIIDHSLATSCLKQSMSENSFFVCEVKDIIVDDTDLVCVNLASFLGPRVASGRQVHECWRRLLLHMMRQRPLGLLDRCAEQLWPRSYQSWLENLRHLYGDRHLGQQGGLGFTPEKMIMIGRSLSTGTYATTSTGGV